MSKRLQPLPLHSLAEACLYVRVTPCPVCAGPLDCDEASFEHDIAHNLLALKTVCRTCGVEFNRQFDTTEVLPADWQTLSGGRISDPWEAPEPAINPTDDPSQAIDLAGWMTLFSLIAEQARTASDPAASVESRARGRHMRRFADACMNEALKFFDEDNDLPPDEAFFRDDTRRQFWERPELFTRQHIANLRFSILKSQG